MLAGKKIILGVSASIAAYKAVLLLRLLKKAGATVKVVTTPDTERFVGPVSWGALADAPPLTDLWEGQWSTHVSLGTWADLMVVAPATANTLAKFANGLCDNALTAVYLAARCPVFVAPAMDADMMVHPATQTNLATLSTHGVRVLPTGTGFLASGLEGPGRLAEPEDIYALIADHFTAKRDLAEKQVLVTAGPTHESLDPVRYLTNHSTGKMGYALAAEAARRGAEVTLVSGPTQLEPPPGVERLSVKSAREMFEAVMAHYEKADLLLFAAAVADYRPKVVAAQKLKKQSGDLRIELERTDDILATVGQKRSPDQVLVGFALETHNAEANARDKLTRKRLDMIVLNSLADEGAGFGHDTNRVTLIDRWEGVTPIPLAAKSEVAARIFDRLHELQSQTH